MNKCLYSILCIEKGSDIITIKKSYRKLALKYHPDRSSIYLKKHNNEMFIEINQAYSILSDRKKKDMYDKYGVIDDGNTDIIFETSEDILKEFNAGFPKENLTREEKEEVAPKTFFQKLKEAWVGAPSTIVAQCNICEGKGVIENNQGFLTMEEECYKCQGYGQIEIEVPYQPQYNNTIQQKNNYWGSE